MFEQFWREDGWMLGIVSLPLVHNLADVLCVGKDVVDQPTRVVLATHGFTGLGHEYLGPQAFGVAVPQAIRARGPSAAGVFPFGLGGESVHMARRFFLGHLAESLAELDGIIPGDVIDRMIVPYYAWLHGFDDLLVLEQHLTLKDAWVLSHDSQVLVLGYLVDPHVEAFGDGNNVRFLYWLGSWLTWIGSHRE